jgi:NADPH:quinone reductase
MKAMVINGFGESSRLEIAEVPTPEAQPDEILIRVAYAGVNPVDWKIREGMLEGLFPHRFPLILGWDAAGTVAALGTGAAGFRVGDNVYAYCRKPTVQWGAYAEYVAIASSAVAPMPANQTFAQAAAIPLTALTSWQALFDAGQLKAGQSVLIHAGAGGTGGMAIQLAKHAGATVFTTANAGNHEYVRSLGADHAIDYQRESFVEAIRSRSPDGVDLAYVTVGGAVLRNSYRVVKPGGALVTIVEAPDVEEAQRLGIRAAFVFVEPNGAQLREITRLIEAGIVRPPEITEMNLEEAPRAQELSQAGHVRGKIVLKIDEHPR